ncbi:MAG: cupin domain-containing protein [bacterium]|nr:cupin domain-containing protein [bacterium]
MQNSAQVWIRKMEMKPHPEGGYFKETYRCEESVKKEHLPDRFHGDRIFSTGIFYLLENDQCSKFHKIKSDEMWHFYDGDGMLIYEIDDNGKLTEHKLGLNINEGEIPQLVIKANRWFGGRVAKSNAYCLAGCTVSPGFHFEDFELADRGYLISKFPQHKTIIESLT